MGLLDGTTQYEYYTGNDQGNYQFTSLEDIINQFLVAYVGEEKIIGKASRTDVAFHAQRAMQELSFDTFKSIKSQEIELPPSLTMMLPHDYVNYTRVMWTDSSGIKHPIYPTKHTQNPFKVRQDDDGTYYFQGGSLEYTLENYDFSSALSVGWTTGFANVPPAPAVDDVSVQGGKLQFLHGAKQFNTGIFARAYSVYQQLNVDGIDSLDLTATVNAASSTSSVKDAGIVRVGIVRDLGVNGWDPSKTSVDAGYYQQGVFIPDTSTQNHLESIFDLPTANGGPSCITWGDDSAEEATDTTTSTQDAGEVGTIDVSAYDNVYIVITSWVPNFSTAVATTAGNYSTNTVDDIKIDYEGISPNLQSGGESTTWTNYKSTTPSENQNSYDDDTYLDWGSERYGLDPQHAQVNGSFYIDNLKGNIHFSSNISGKTVVLDYISDSLGTDGEMQVHKFAEEAMYKWIMYAILSTRANTPEYIVRRYQKEKFAATRTAKLRLSNIKLEELTQILRGKSKHIKH